LGSSGQSDAFLLKLASEASMAAEAKKKGMQPSEYKRLMKKVKGKGADEAFLKNTIPQKGDQDAGSEKNAVLAKAMEHLQGQSDKLKGLTRRRDGKEWKGVFGGGYRSSEKGASLAQVAANSSKNQDNLARLRKLLQGAKKVPGVTRS
jgi:hypothetical protein